MRRLRVKDLLLLAATLAVVGLGALWLWTENVVQRVFLVNRLGLPVDVSIDGHSQALPAFALVTTSLHRGVHLVKVSAGGRVLDEGPIDVPGGSTVVAYNVLGAGPLYNDTVVYGAGNASPAERFDFYGGQRLVAVANADFVFTQPPRSISVDSSASGPQTRWHFDLADGGWQATASMLRDRGASETALRVSLDVARARPDDGEALLTAAELLAERRGSGAAVVLLRHYLESHPDAVEVHRTHQHFLRRSGRLEEARAYYRAFRAARPGDVRSAVLLARVEGPDPALGLYEEARRLEPADAVARRGLALALLARGRFDESARLLDEMAKDDPEYKYYVDDHVRSLLGAHRGAEAATAAAKASEKFPAEWRPAVLFAQLAATEGVESPLPGPTFIDRITKKSQDPAFGWWMLSMAGLPLDDARIRKAGRSGGPLVEAALIQQAAASDPARAWALCTKAADPVLRRLGSPVGVLLGAEFLRGGDPRMAERLFAAQGELNLPAEALRAYVLDGVEDPEMWRLAPEMRAALDLVRSRRLAGDRAASAALVAAARRREGVRGPVTRAAESWPAPEAPAGTVTLRRRERS
jgi:tetratricopeptide (TPR) repeat protein